MHRETHRSTVFYANHFILYGPPSSGKGYSGSPIIKDELVHPIVTGDMIRTRFEKDLVFKNKWGKKVADGELVSDECLTPMVTSRYSIGKMNRKPIFMWDGWHRTIKQIEEFDNRFLCVGERSTVIYINAGKNTCKDRNDHRNRIANRIDGGSFNTRWAIYEKHNADVLSAFKECNIEVVEINGDDDLDNIARSVWAQWCRFTGNEKEMPAIKRREAPVEEYSENPGSSKLPFGFELTTA